MRPSEIQWNQPNLIPPQERECNGIQFTVLGVAQPQGSTRAFIPKGWNRAIITSDNPKNKSWRQETSNEAMIAMQGKPMMEGPVELIADFYFDKPKSTKKSVVHKITKPDVSKLARSCEDAMTGIVYKDDSQIVSETVRKHFGLPARAVIQVRQL